MYSDQKTSPRAYGQFLGGLFGILMIGFFIFHNSDGMLFDTWLTPPDYWTTPASYVVIFVGAAIAFVLADKLIPSGDEGTGNVWRFGIAGFAAWALYMVAGPIMSQIDENLNFPANTTKQFHANLPIGRLYEGLVRGRVDYHATLAKYDTWFTITDDQYAMIKGITLKQAHDLDMQTTDVGGWCVAVTVQKSGSAVRILTPQPWQIVACPSTGRNPT